MSDFTTKRAWELHAGDYVHRVGVVTAVIRSEQTDCVHYMCRTVGDWTHHLVSPSQGLVPVADFGAGDEGTPQ